MLKKTMFILALVFSLVACRLAGQVTQPQAVATTKSPAPVETTEQVVVQPKQSPQDEPEPALSPLQFCQDVSDDGQCLGLANRFATGTNTVWAYFTYQDMQDGMSWGRLWKQDDQVYLAELDEQWEDGSEGWVAYSISEDPQLSGAYSLELYLDGRLVQQAGFEVDPAEVESGNGFPAFGPIQLSSDVTEDRIPVDPINQFSPGVTRVYATFPYMNLPAGQNWGFAWLYNGSRLTGDERQWDGEQQGITYLWLEDQDGLDAGTYTFNLYLDGQLTRSADFEVTQVELPGEDQPRTDDPADLVDADLMPAYEMLRNSDMEILYRLADLVLDYQIELRIVDTLDSGLAVYCYDANTCDISEKGQRAAGDVLVSRQFWNDNTWEEVAAAVAHELTHAFQHLYTTYRCGGCSVQKEYEAFTVEIYALEEMGRMDLVEKNWPGLTDSKGYIDQDLLWQVIQKSYDDCPDY